MRPIHLNLAAKPYRNYRPVWIAVALLSVVTLALTLYNVDAAYRYFVNTKETRARIASIDQETATEVKRNQELESQLKRVNVVQLGFQTTYINARIAERAFSWSQLLDQLERVLPNDVRLVQLNPTVDKQGATHVQLSLESKTPAGLIKTIQKLQGTPYFSRPFPLSQSTRDGGLTSFLIQMDYNPEPRGLLE
ncbi:MAG TPA: hypothetical protein VNM92_07895 [Thermoanaerobaculia bacterium]|nr:hypothetical protein [Thermoanaerobaculia bacterium]